MKTIHSILIALFATSFLAFTPDTLQTQEFHGVWVRDGHNGFHPVFVKSDSFDVDKAGIHLMSDGTLIKRQNIGWCGTPPISYGNEKGTWKQTSDSTLTITYAYWGGTTEEDWIIRELSGNKMTVSITNRN